MSLGFTDGVCFWVMYFKAWSPLSTILIPIAWEAFVMSLFFDSTYCVLKSSPPGILLPLLGWSWGAVLELITVVEPKTPGVISLSSNDTPHYLQNWSSAVLFPPSCALFFTQNSCTKVLHVGGFGQRVGLAPTRRRVITHWHRSKVTSGILRQLLQ